MLRIVCNFRLAGCTQFLIDALRSFAAHDRAMMTKVTKVDHGGAPMATCEVCGNQYDKSFEVHINGQRHTFDSLECAIQRLRLLAVIVPAALLGME